MHALASVARGILLSLILLLAPAGLMLIVYAESLRATLAGLTGLLLVVAAALAYASRLRPAGIVATASAALLFGIGVGVPGTKSAGPVHSSALPLSLSQLLPEIDHVKMGIVLGPILDPIINGSQAKRIAQLMLPIYRTLQTEDRRSALSLGYMEVFGGSHPPHMYWSVPAASAQGNARPPAIIFLHGAAGNFLAYSELLRRTGAVVVCPTNGFGLYRNQAQTAAIVQRAWRFATDELGADPKRIYLAALSQGGAGATQFAQSRPELAGLILISPVLDQRATQAWRGPNVLLLHGAQDRRIPKAYVEGHAALLATSTATISTRYFPGEDHFLLFSQPEAVLGEIPAWMAHGRPAE